MSQRLSIAWRTMSVTKNAISALESPRLISKLVGQSTISIAAPSATSGVPMRLSNATSSERNKIKKRLESSKSAVCDRIPVSDINQRVAFLGRLENLDVVPAIQAAKVIVNSRTGSVVMNQKVALQNCAVSHGSLTVTIGNEQQVSQPNAFSGGQTAVTNKGGVDIKQVGGNIFNVKGSSNLADVVKALNAVGANPLELIAILQAMKASGALRAELEVI